jgi:hypothetical protein
VVEFCPHCGEVGGLRQQGDVLVCSRCGQQAGSVPVPVAPVIVKQADELLRQGTAALCPICGQLVERRGAVLARHFDPKRKVCPGSSKPPTAAGDSMIREAIRVVSCGKGEPPRIEALTLAYLEPRDRVRVQIDALRDILGPQFRMGDYPAPLGRPQLAVWASATHCVIGKRHEQGGYQTLSDAELAQVVDDWQRQPALFFG